MAVLLSGKCIIPGSLLPLYVVAVLWLAKSINQKLLLVLFIVMAL